MLQENDIIFHPLWVRPVKAGKHDSASVLRKCCWGGGGTAGTFDVARTGHWEPPLERLGRFMERETVIFSSELFMDVMCVAPPPQHTHTVAMPIHSAALIPEGHGDDGWFLTCSRFFFDCEPADRRWSLSVARHSGLSSDGLTSTVNPSIRSLTFPHTYRNGLNCGNEKLIKG